MSDARSDTTIHYRLRPPVDNETLNALFAAAWSDHAACDFVHLLAHSLTYVCAYAVRDPIREQEEELAGFVKLAWDGGVHAFLLDTTVHPAWQRRGIGQQLVHHATAAATEHGIEWVHVDYEPQLTHFYKSCGFRHTAAGLFHIDN